MTLRIRAAVVAVVAVSLLAAGPVVAASSKPASSPASSDSRSTASIDSSSAIVELTGAPLATLNNGQSKRVDLKGAKAKSARAQLMAIRNDFKQWLRANAPKARVTSEYDIALNAVSVDLNGTDVAVLRTAPNVTGATLQLNYRQLSVDPDLALINALEGWDGRGAAGAGAGVKVAVIDSGIDQTHPCFDGIGGVAYPDFPGDPGDTRYTNAKVVVAKVFNMRAKSRGYDAFPGDGQDHGTHVAGTIACEPETAATVDTATIPYGVTGVAPAAQLGNYNVFPGPVENARSEDILNALQAAFEDGMDVANMSLGGGANGVQDLLTHAVDNLDRGGMVIAISAGNNGPGYLTIGSPGSAERALTSGAYAVGHFVGLPVTWTEHSIVTATGEFAVPSSDLSAELEVLPGAGDLDAPIGLACAPLAAESLTAKIALVGRGGCTFGTKVYNAEQAGAIGVIVVNRVAGSPTAMAGDGHSTTIPAVMASLGARSDLMAADGLTITLHSEADYIHQSTNDRIMQDFSSQGPTDVDFRVKPDAVAPGGNVLSSILGHGWAFFSGTSMSSPHMAGMAAVVLSQHVGWEPWKVRSAIVNTANSEGLKRYSDAASETDPLIIGNGAADLNAAVEARVALDPVSTSFGLMPQQNGKVWSRTITLARLGGSGELSVSVSGSSAFTAAINGDVITVTFTPRASLTALQHAQLTVRDGAGVAATCRLFALVK